MKKFVSIAAAALAAFLHANVASAADNYPNKPVRVVVPFAAGGPTDVVTRKVTELLSARLGQPVIVDNR
ncbi:MAG: tripartite tricarboxylate transporter substrate binding protein BugD, partial [Hyphomicrobium sp.]|nr:tripartite tricarboxylate transporter substrate binding protein BugD [Hyphomicrobium sp.]